MDAETDIDAFFDCVIRSLQKEPLAVMDTLTNAHNELKNVSVAKLFGLKDSMITETCTNNSIVEPRPSEADPWIHPKWEHTYVRLAEQIYTKAAVKELKGHEDGYYGDAEFEGVAEVSSKVIRIFKILMQNLQSLKTYKQSEKCPVFRKIVYAISLRGLLLSIEHKHIGNVEQPWTNEDTHSSADELMQEICNIYNCGSAMELLCCNGESVPMFSAVWRELNCRLQKTKWKNNPSVKCSFVTCLFFIRFPFTSDYLDLILPPSLNFVDDFELENKVLGLQCVEHIIDNVTKSELLRYGRAEVLYKAVQQQLHTSEGRLLAVALPCLLKILLVVEKPPMFQDSPISDSRYDDIMVTFLRNMEIENKLINRRLYAEYLSVYLEKIGVAMVKHFPRLIRVVSTFLDVQDGAKEEARLNMLKAVQVIIKFAWPRVPHHTPTIFRALMKLLYDITNPICPSQETAMNNILEMITECLILLKRSSPEITLRLLCAMQHTDIFNEKCKQVIQSVMDD